MIKPVSTLLALALYLSSASLAAAPLSHKDLLATVQEAAKMANIGRGVEKLKASYDRAYQIVIQYDPRFFSKSHWQGMAQDFADHDTYHLAASFVKLLAKKGRDPSMSGSPHIIAVCAQVAGSGSVTDHSTDDNLGCSEYTPATNSVSLNSNMY